MAIEGSALVKAFEDFIGRLMWYCTGMSAMASFLGRDDLAWRWFWGCAALLGVQFVTGFVCGFSKRRRRRRQERQ